MGLRRFINWLLVGDLMTFNSEIDIKKSFFVSQISLFALGTGFLYLLLNEFTLFSIHPLSLIILILSTLIVLIINRIRYYKLSTVIFLIGVELSVMVDIDLGGFQKGSYFFLISVFVAALIVFELKNLKQLLFVISVLVTAFFIGSFTDFTLKKYLEYTPTNVQINFLINFLINVLFLIKLVFFQVSMVFDSYRKLKQITDEAVMNRTKLALAIKGSSVGIWEWDIDKDEITTSPLLNSMLGYSQDQIIKVSSSELLMVFHPDDRVKVIKTLKKHLFHRSKYVIECRLKCSNDDYISTLISGQAYWDNKGNPKSMLGTIVNINDLKTVLSNMETQNKLLEKINMELEKFVYSTSHDLKSPLNSILGLVTIAEISSDRNEVKECFKKIEDRVKVLKKFIEEIIDYSKNTRTGSDNHYFNLKKLVDEVLESLQDLPNADKIFFNIDIDQNQKIYTDRERMRIILKNIISNAIKYHNYKQKSQPYINIYISKPIDRLSNNQEFVISVADNGVGISKTYQDKIFDMFYRASEISDGTGLGLYIANEMATKIFGKISFFSELGKGTVFNIRFQKNIIK